jgi:MGT family glycosyltransferase
VSRFLFVVPPLTGHVNPTIGVGAALARRGHRIGWAGQPDIVRALVGQDVRVYPCAAPSGADATARPPDLRGPAALKFLWERFLIPLAEQMVPDVRAAVAAFQPDALVVDQQTLAGALVAEADGIPWATASTTSAELTEPLASMPRVLDWIQEQLADLRRRVGVEALTAGDPRFSPRLVLAFTSEALTGPVEHLRDRVRFVGPSIAPRPAGDDFPWSWLDRPGPAVLVTLGTVNADAGARFLRECVQAVAGRPAVSAVVVDPTGVIDHAPANVLVRPRVPQLDLLPRMAAVICHAGHNTVCESLYHGVPLAVAPIRDDQPVIAQQVVGAGAGVRLRFGRATAGHLGAAVDSLLTDSGYAMNARRIGASFRTAGGAEAAATHLERMLEAETPAEVHGGRAGEDCGDHGVNR